MQAQTPSADGPKMSGTVLAGGSGAGRTTASHGKADTDGAEWDAGRGRDETAHNSEIRGFLGLFHRTMI